jgi:hypothetical protein
MALSPRFAQAQRAADAKDPTADLYPAQRNEAFTLDRPVTDEKLNGNYNNFYEFGMQKTIAEPAQALPIRPWTVKIDGMVEKEQTLDIDTLIRKVGIEERLYRHRCVEAWSMAVPWSGFPLAKLVALAKPLGSAKYVRMETFMNPKVAGEQRKTWYPWPYVEGLTMAEAGNDQTFLVTGAYGHPLPKQHGAPLRLVGELLVRAVFVEIVVVDDQLLVGDRPVERERRVALGGIEIGGRVLRIGRALRLRDARRERHGASARRRRQKTTAVEEQVFGGRLAFGHFPAAAADDIHGHSPCVGIGMMLGVRLLPFTGKSRLRDRASIVTAPAIPPPAAPRRSGRRCARSVPPCGRT